MGFSGFHGGENFGFKKIHGCKKKNRPPKAAENFWPFFKYKIKISVEKLFFFFDLSGSEIFDISEFHGRKILEFSGCHGGKILGFQESYGRKKITWPSEAAKN